MSSPAWKPVAIIMIVAALSLAAYYAVRARQIRQTPSASIDAGSSVDAAHAQSGAMRRRTDDRSAGADSDPDAADLPKHEIPADQAIEALLAMAQQGRADAMRELSMRLIECARADKTSDDAALRDGALKRFYWRNGHEPSSDSEISELAAEVDLMSRRRGECSPVAKDLLASRIDWLEKSARAGDVQAKVDYARWGLQDMDRDDILMRPGELERRRELAADFLQQALTSGRCDVLPLLADAYGGARGVVDWIFQPDPALAVTYEEANRRRDSFLANAPEGLPPPVERDLPPDRLDAARRQGEALHARFCHDD